MTGDTIAGASEPLSRLLGRWICMDEWSTWVAIEIEWVPGQRISVRATDTNDSENAEIYDVKFEGEVLEFAAHWSTGYFTKYKVRALGHHMEVTATYTRVDHFKKA
ncbi:MULTISPECIES: hypothetical protein [unclassified Hyphomicrobium]|uniref:hypothetical protein n=1 Tax=unclassified Hyphomicrobium TaxID=2619925 RepID=UPI000213F7A9|nr:MULTISPECIES: hypothetical protein [unclassified Hyphomicrobium]CCB63261.1 conserved protein of unknown function [Hyphomicrobium sp. MC1]